MPHQASDLFWQSPRSQQALSTPLTIEPRAIYAGLLVFVGYYLGVQVGFALTFQPHPISVFWPPNSVLLAALLLTPPRTWWFLLVAAFPAHLIAELQFQVPPTMIVCWFVSNSCEALIGAGLIRYLLGGPVRFDILRSVAVFCLCGAFLGPFLSSFVDAGFVVMNGWGEGSYSENWPARFFSNVLTTLTLTPAILTWSNFRPIQWRRISSGHALEGSLLFLGLVIASTVVLYNARTNPDPVLFYAPLPFLLWAVFRFGARATSAAILIVTFLAIWSSAHGHGPFTNESVEISARSMQKFLIVMAVPIMLLAAGIQERRKAEERFVNAFRASPDPMSIIRQRDGTLLDVNDHWVKTFGYERREAIGRTLLDLNLCLSEGGHVQQMVGFRRSKPISDLECSVRTKAGEVRQVSLSADTVEMGDEPCFIVIIRDITDRKLVEEANRDLAHASRVALLGELTASIAHEINQPLGAILSNADAAELLLESESPSLDEVRKILADIRNDDLRASEIIRHIRLLTRKHVMQMESLDVNELAGEVVRLMEAEARRRNVSLRTKFTAAPATIFGDRVHLQQVLMNLLLNGMEAMGDTPESQRRLLLRTATNGQRRVEISVIDSGRGIPPEKLSRLFESFFTTKENGMGLGLAIARSIIDSHHGQIFAENNSDVGATFRFDLPVGPEAAQVNAVS
jgi:two-component system, LuxR family, sensor kinase FixL